MKVLKRHGAARAASGDLPFLRIPAHPIIQFLGHWRYRVRSRVERLRRAWGYGLGGLSADHAQQIMLDCRDAAGWRPLFTLTVERVLEEARDTFVEHPALLRLIADACARVEYKWEPVDDALYEAHRWAINLAETYAQNEHIVLTRWDRLPLAQ
jgi:hypothetical protein